jgi:hypothetical protein
MAKTKKVAPTETPVVKTEDTPKAAGTIKPRSLAALLQRALNALQGNKQDVAKAVALIKEAHESLQSRRAASSKQPSKYNIFVKETMATLRTEHPEMTNIQRMKKCAELWRESKAK